MLIKEKEDKNEKLLENDEDIEELRKEMKKIRMIYKENKKEGGKLEVILIRLMNELKQKKVKEIADYRQLQESQL